MSFFSNNVSFLY